MPPRTPADDPRHTEQPVYWFAILEMARERGDYDLAAEAQRELERLGVRVRYRRPREEATHA